MNASLQSETQWAEEHFGEVRLGDRRRERRLVAVAAALARHPSGVLPAALPKWGQLKAAYRLLSHEQTSAQRLLEPHLARTRAVCVTQPGEYLLIEDTTGLDFSSRKACAGLGRIGDDGGRGFLVHSTLAVRLGALPEAEGAEDLAEGALGAEVVGLAAQARWVRPEESLHSTHEPKAKRLARPRESQRWAGALLEDSWPQAPAPGCRCILVADREADLFELFGRCRARGLDFLVRACQPRALAAGADPAEPGAPSNVLAAVRAAPPLGEVEVALRARPGSPARTARLQVRALAQVSLRAPWRPKGAKLCAQSVHVVSADEVHAPRGVAPIGWVLLSSLPAASLEQARALIARYSQRWLVEEYHKALKTGARVEHSQLQSRARLEALLAVLALVAVRLLDLKLLARQPTRRALPAGALNAPALALLERATGTAPPPEGWSVQATLVAIAKLGGFLARRGDGPPGWQTLWRGWQRLLTMTDALALLKPPGTP